jgi:hypothetical protein
VAEGSRIEAPQSKRFVLDGLPVVVVSVELKSGFTIVSTAEEPILFRCGYRMVDSAASEKSRTQPGTHNNKRRIEVSISGLSGLN